MTHSTPVDEQRRRPASYSSLLIRSPPFDLVSIVNTCSGRQLEPHPASACRSSTSLEPLSRFWLTDGQLAARVELARGSA